MDTWVCRNTLWPKRILTLWKGSSLLICPTYTISSFVRVSSHATPWNMNRLSVTFPRLERPNLTEFNPISTRPSLLYALLISYCPKTWRTRKWNTLKARWKLSPKSLCQFKITLLYFWSEDSSIMHSTSSMKHWKTLAHIKIKVEKILH